MFISIVVVEKQYILNILSVCLYSFLSYLAWKAHAPYYIVISGLSGSTIFFTLPHKWHNLKKKKKSIGHYVYYDFLYNPCLKYISFQEEFGEILS